MRALGLQLLEQRGRLQGFTDLCVEGIDNIGWRSGRYHHALPRAHFEIRHYRFGQGGRIRQLRATSLAADRQRVELAVAHEAQRVVQGVRHELHLATDQVCHGGRAATVRHVYRVNTYRTQEQQSAQVRDVASAGGPVGKLAGVSLGVADELTHVLDWQGRVREQHKRNDCG
ncbi:hypothetical protein D3C72_1554740 [compost metagenome]